MKKALLPRLAVGILILASLIVIAGFAPPDGEEEKPLPSDFDVEPTLTYDAFFKLADAANYELSPKGTPVWMTQISDGSPLNWPEIVCINNETEILEALKNSNNGMPPPASEIDPICLDMGEPVFDLYQLTGDVILPPVETGKAVAIVLEPVGIPVPFTAKVVGGHRPGNLLFNHDGSLLAIYTPLLTRLSSPSYTDTFTVEIKSNGATHYFDITVPVKLAIDGAYSHTFRIGQNVNTQFGYSGGPLTCNSVPTLPSGGPAVPCGPLNWSYAQTEGGPLPAGLTLNSRNGDLNGTTSYLAYSSRGKLHLGQSGETAQRSVEFLVPVYLAQGDITALAHVQGIERGETYNFPLPQPMGGDGANYTWAFEYSFPDRLPSGLSIDQTGSVHGTVADGATIGQYNVHLTVSSPLGDPASLTMNFRLTVPFNVWTQNANLRPPRIIPPNEEMQRILIAAPPEAWYLWEIQEAYNLLVDNTETDNQQRTRMILREARNHDIVVLQEVFSEDNQRQIVDDVRADYFTMFGPPADPVPIFSDYVELLLNSGLAVMIRKDLAPSQSFQHWSVPFNETGGISEADGWASKGLTLDKVQFGPNANDYIYVVNTHAKAGEHDENPPGYGLTNREIREAQFLELIDFVGRETDRDHPVLIMGDFNSVEATLAVSPATGMVHTSEYYSMLGILGLNSQDDLFRANHTLSADPGFTWNTDRSAYLFNWEGPGPKKRLDYILVWQGNQFRIEVDTIGLTDFLLNDPVTDRSMCTEQGWPGLPGAPATMQCYLSDHFGIEADLRLVTP